MIKLKFVWILNRKPFNVRKHIHSCYELIYYFNAKGTVEYYLDESLKDKEIENINYIDKSNSFGEETLHFFDNTMIIIPPHSVHNEQHLEDCNVIDIGFEIENEEFERFDTQLVQDSSLVFYNLISKIKEEYIAKKNHYREYIASLINQVLIELERLNTSATEQVNPIQFARNYIRNNYTNIIDLEYLAKLSGYGPERFRFLFKQEVGVSPKEYIIDRRIDSAKKMLLTTNFPINQISELVGYNDIAQFTTIFKKKTGISPSKFRTQML